jgi:signal transduction histidine kinase
MLLIGGLLIQHSRRRRAESALRRSEARNSAILEFLLIVTDSGIGFDPLGADHAGLGLASMRERVAHPQGSVDD